MDPTSPAPRYEGTTSPDHSIRMVQSEYRGGTTVDSGASRAPTYGGMTDSRASGSSATRQEASYGTSYGTRPKEEQHRETYQTEQRTSYEDSRLRSTGGQGESSGSASGTQYRGTTSYGQGSTSYGQGATSYGQGSGSGAYGQGSGSFGQGSGSYGQTSGAYGETSAHRETSGGQGQTSYTYGRTSGYTQQGTSGYTQQGASGYTQQTGSRDLSGTQRSGQQQADQGSSSRYTGSYGSSSRYTTDRDKKP